MKTHIRSIIAAMALVASLDQASADPIGTMFTYQGQLIDTNVPGPATGLYDFRFSLFGDPNGVLNLGQLPPATIGVTNGLFIAPLNFGVVFTGDRRWLQIEVRLTGTLDWNLLSPLQEITPTPYAMFAENAGLVGGITPGGFWGTRGNNVSPGNNELGTSDSQPLVLIVAGQEAQRFEPTTDTPNVIGGWSSNSVAAGLVGATIGGGGTAILFNGQSQPNTISNSGYYGTISGGYHNLVGGYGGFIGGGAVNIASNNFSAVMAGEFNDAGGAYSSIGGGVSNTNTGDYSAVGGGSLNTCIGFGSTVGGGEQNISGNFDDTVGGGQLNNCNGGDATVGGGYQNSSLSFYATVGGGYQNNSGGDGATVGGGNSNSASGAYATIPGGIANSAEGISSFAAGNRAKSHNKGTFVWADSQNADFDSTRDNQVAFRCQSGVFFDNGAGLFVNWTPGAGDWAFASDRNLKDRMAAVDSEAILEKVVRLPLAEWSYKGYSQRHIGPMAQDFHALFPLNDDDKRLIGADLHGVALAAIQGLNKKVEDQRAELAAKQTQIDQLRVRLDQLEQRLVGSGRDQSR
jgi:trimeric autotransporter adhesin